MQFSGSSRRKFCSERFDTMHFMCTDLLCVACIELLSAEFSNVKSIQDWVGLCFGNLRAY